MRVDKCLPDVVWVEAGMTEVAEAAASMAEVVAAAVVVVVVVVTAATVVTGICLNLRLTPSLR